MWAHYLKEQERGRTPTGAEVEFCEEACDGRHGGEIATEPNIPRDDGFEHFFLEELADVTRHELTQVRSIVVHRQQHAIDLEAEGVVESASPGARGTSSDTNTTGSTASSGRIAS